MTEAQLGRFIDRYTIEYVRTYPHPIERVWRAITNPAEFGVWFIPGEIDLRKGGAYQLPGEWGGTVLDLEPPRLIRFDNSRTDGEGSWYQFQLEAMGAGTRMTFQHHGKPGGPETPFHPGTLAGWHEFWDALGDFLDNVSNPRRRERWMELTVIYESHVGSARPAAAPVEGA